MPKGIDIEGTVVGQVSAGGIQNFGPINFVSPSEPSPESERQARFYRDTGIWCPRGAREIFETLLDEHGYTAKELALAWNSGSLKWVEESRQLKTNTPILEASYGWSMVVFFCLYIVIATLKFKSVGLMDLSTFGKYLILVSMFTAAVFLAIRMYLWPRAVAIRVRKCLAAGVDVGGTA